MVVFLFDWLSDVFDSVVDSLSSFSDLFSDDEQQKAIALSLLVTMVSAYFMFSDPFGMGFGSMSLMLRIVFLVCLLPCSYFAAKITMDRT